MNIGIIILAAGSSKPGRASYCGTVMESRFFTVYEGPMFADAFRDLRPEPDGSLKSKGERTAGAGQSSCTTNYSLTLRRDCRDPAAMSGYYTRDPFGPETPADIAPSCESCPSGTWQLKIGEVSYHIAQSYDTPREGVGPSFPDSCAYTYESIWLCAATGEVTKKTKTKLVNESCHTKG